jgi:hypothetical protein
MLIIAMSNGLSLHIIIISLRYKNLLSSEMSNQITFFVKYEQ